MMDNTFLPERMLDLSEVWSINAAKEDIREEWAQVGRRHDLDVLICPGSRSTAVPHGKYGAPVWTMIWNLLDVRNRVPNYCHEMI